MGERYSINLYFELDRLEQALRAAANFATPQGESVPVVLPSGLVLSLPFSRNLEDENRVIRSGELGIYLAAAFRFAVDEEIQSMSDVLGININEQEADIGMFDLSINPGWRYVELSFAAAFSLLSILVRDSASIHQKFRDLLRDVGGVAGIIDVESDDDEFLLLSDPKQTIHLDRQKFLDDEFDPDNGGTDYDVDGFTAALLIECDRPRGA